MYNQHTFPTKNDDDNTPYKHYQQSFLMPDRLLVSSIKDDSYKTNMHLPHACIN